MAASQHRLRISYPATVLQLPLLVFYSGTAIHLQLWDKNYFFGLVL